MSRMAPITRKELTRRLQKLGFEGPFPGGRHDFMRRSTDRLKVALPRADAKSREIGVELQKRILREVGATSREWMALAD
ncbi:MAG: type II toxin-antitoxin system HicA family toxin [Planctomycetes bacterium]|nr:type II toxin-antitoxin system HicA family toxin [Planctomycetota bacterium]